MDRINTSHGPQIQIGWPEIAARGSPRSNRSPPHRTHPTAEAFPPNTGGEARRRARARGGRHCRTSGFGDLAP
jgi:hypothetical protein